jgi:hypothetical protein
MQRLSVAFLLATSNLQRAIGILGTSESEDEARPQVHQALSEFLTECASLPLPASFIDQVQQLLRKTQMQEYPGGTLLLEIGNLHRALFVELVHHLFMFIPQRRKWFYLKPVEWFAEPVVTRFAGIERDVRDACQCFALAQWTASVFHAMRVLEIGLRALATHVGVSLKFSLDFADWQNLIDGVDARIKALQQQQKGQARSDELEFLARSAAEFRYFKEAWRNHVSHARQSYDEQEAWSVLSHARDFMGSLAAGLP